MMTAPATNETSTGPADAYTSNIEEFVSPEYDDTEAWTGEVLLHRILTHPERYVPAERYMPSDVETILGKYDLATSIEESRPDLFSGLAERVRERLKYNERNTGNLQNNSGSEVVGREAALTAN